MKFNLRLVQAEWMLGLIQSNDLPGIAIQALTAGYNSNSLTKLSVMDQADGYESLELFRSALVELKLQGMSKEEAVKEYAKKISLLILGSDVPPIDGARLIWDATLKAGLHEFHDLDGFIYAASEYDGRPEDNEFFNRAIFEEAKLCAGL